MLPWRSGHEPNCQGQARRKEAASTCRADGNGGGSNRSGDSRRPRPALAIVFQAARRAQQSSWAKQFFEAKRTAEACPRAALVVIGWTVLRSTHVTTAMERRGYAATIRLSMVMWLWNADMLTITAVEMENAIGLTDARMHVIDIGVHETNRDMSEGVTGMTHPAFVLTPLEPTLVHQLGMMYDLLIADPVDSSRSNTVLTIGRGPRGLMNPT